MYVEVSKNSVIIMGNTYQILFYVMLLLIHLSHVCVNIYVIRK